MILRFYSFEYSEINKKERLPIWRDSNRLLLEIEQAVRDFSCYHKYTIGSYLRRQAMYVCRMLVGALSAEGQQRVKPGATDAAATYDWLKGVQSSTLSTDNPRLFVSKVVVCQQGYLKGGLRRRCVELITVPPLS